MTPRITAVMAALMVVQGCATMDQEECITSDWHAVGFEDGARGYPVDRISRHRKACAQHGITTDLGAYRQGRDEGLRHYCTAQNGFNVGSSGSSYAGVCPEDLADDFELAYSEGKRLHDLDRRVRSAETRIDALERQVADLDQQIDGHEKTIIASGTDNLERARLLLEIKDLVDHREDLEDEIEDLEHERAASRQELEEYRETVAYSER